MFAALAARLLPYKALAVLAVLSLLAGLLVIQSARLSAAQSTIEAKVATIAGLSRLMEAQNAGIEQLARESVKREKAAVIAKKAAAKAVARAEARVSEIASMPVPPSCEAAIQFLVEDAAHGVTQ